MDEKTISVEIPKIGTRVTYAGELWEILYTTTYQEDITVFVTICRILRVSDNGEDLGFPAESAYSDKLTIV
jgi:hypothetical protein